MSEDALFSLAGQVAVVIGGGGVLAGAMATGLAQAGADIAILDVFPEAAEARATAIAALGRQAIGVQCDATSKADLREGSGTVLERFGHVDTLHQCGGGELRHAVLRDHRSKSGSASSTSI